MTIPQYISKLTIRRGWTRSAFAIHILGVSASTITRMIHGQTKMSKAVKQRLRRAIDDLIDDLTILLQIIDDED